ncbi:hypothetical protein [Sphingomicrobium arenosum]|uniref:hypothetical protein n=1 Tax=Sphingomicrobium arenosum TaxID=2233861 RepID=UPI00223F0380|nr:hypothetical protein [Sphingomicrobium arenosum]
MHKMMIAAMAATMATTGAIAAPVAEIETVEENTTVKAKADDERKVCHKQATSGSRFERKVCKTVAEWREIAEREGLDD